MERLRESVLILKLANKELKDSLSAARDKVMDYELKLGILSEDEVNDMRKRKQEHEISEESVNDSIVCV